jgi:hypothetical protein
MRNLFMPAMVATIMFTMPAGVFAQAAPSPTATPAAAAHYTTGDTDIGTLLDDPAAKIVLTKHIPDMVNSAQIDQARSMTLKQIQQYAPDMLSDKVLADIDAELAKVPGKH